MSQPGLPSKPTVPADRSESPNPLPLSRFTVRGDRLGIAASRVTESFPARCAARFALVGGRDRALALAGQAFTALIPALVLVAAIAPGDRGVADRLNERLGLTGGAANAVNSLFSRPPGAAELVTAAGVVLALSAALSYAKSLQRAFDAAWGWPAGRGWRRAADGLGALVLLLLQFAVVAILGDLLRGAPGGVALTAIAPAPLVIATWLQAQKLLLSRRVRYSQLLPGAAAAWIGQTAVAVYSTVWMPHLVTRYSERYGIIGVAVALLAWLVVVSLGMVAVAVVSAEANTGGSAQPGEAPSGARPVVSDQQISHSVPDQGRADGRTRGS